MRTGKPVAHAFLAALYIALLVFILQSMSEMKDLPETYVAPMLFLSVFTLSAAIMGYLFLSQPILLYLEGKKKEGIASFGLTVATFAIITILLLLGIVLRSVM